MEGCAVKDAEGATATIIADASEAGSAACSASMSVDRCVGAVGAASLMENAPRPDGSQSLDNLFSELLLEDMNQLDPLLHSRVGRHL
jgi:hypothetical protein